MNQRVRDAIHAGNCVVDWNKAHKVGDRVVVRRDVGPLFHTTTRSEAQLTGDGHRAVIFLEGIAGYYLLDRVQAE